MVDDVILQIENALDMIVNFMDKSGNMKKELKKSIYEAVSNLRNLIFILISNLLKKAEENTARTEVSQLKDTLEKGKPASSARQAAPSVTNNPGLTSSDTAASSPPIGGKKKLFSEVL